MVRIIKESRNETEASAHTCQRKSEVARQNSGPKSVTRNRVALLSLSSLSSVSSSEPMHRISQPQTLSSQPFLPTKSHSYL